MKSTKKFIVAHYGPENLSKLVEARLQELGYKILAPGAPLLAETTKQAREADNKKILAALLQDEKLAAVAGQIDKEYAQLKVLDMTTYSLPEVPTVRVARDDRMPRPA